MLLPAHAPAQQAPAPNLTIDAAIAAALERNRTIASGRRQVDIAQGELMSTRGQFDSRLRTSVAETHTEQRVLDGAGGVGADAVSSRRSSYEVGLARELRSGFVIQPGVSVMRADEPLATPHPYAQANVGLGLAVPLGRNRWGEMSRLSEQVAESGRSASEFQLRQTVAQTVRDVVSAYWSYLAASEHLEVYGTSEARALRLLEETRTLVQAEERPAADLNQVQANLSSKRMSRLRAEQSLRLARQNLGLILGRDARQSAELPLPSDPFPALADFRADATRVAGLVELSASHRPEFSVSAHHLRSASLLRDAARAAAKPRVDLEFNLGYAGLASTADLAGTLSPLYRDIPGVNGSVQLSYEISIANRQARGGELQRAAALEQQRLAGEDLGQRIASQVMMAAASLEQSVLVLAEVETAVELYRAAVENEKKKYELGVATLFDVILAEDNLTGVLLSRVDSRLDHAVSISSLRYETGTLVSGDGSVRPFAAAVVSTPP